MHRMPILDKTRHQPQPTLHNRAMQRPPRAQAVQYMVPMLRPYVRARTQIAPVLRNLLGEIGREVPFPWAGALHFFFEHFVEELFVIAGGWQPAEVYGVEDAALGFCFAGRGAAFGDDEGVAVVAFVV